MCRIFKSFPICIFFVAVSSWEFFLCRSSPWHPGVLNLVSFTWVSHRIGCLTGLGVPLLGHRMFPLWRILCRLRHFVAKRDVFMAANPSAASPRNFGDTVGRTQLWPPLTKTQKSSRSKSFPPKKSPLSFLHCFAWWENWLLSKHIV